MFPEHVRSRRRRGEVRERRPPLLLRGGPGWGTCPHSTFAFTVTTWTMSLSTSGEEEPVAWVVDGVLDCEELWAMPGYEGLPRVPPVCPVVSPDNPDVVCFKVSNGCLVGYYNYQEKVWMLEVDTRRKVLLSGVRTPVPQRRVR